MLEISVPCKIRDVRITRYDMEHYGMHPPSIEFALETPQSYPDYGIGITTVYLTMPLLEEQLRAIHEMYMNSPVSVLKTPAEIVIRIGKKGAKEEPFVKLLESKSA